VPPTPPPPETALATTDETALIAALQAGDDAAYQTLVETHIGRMLAVARRMLGNEDDANDAVQDAFLSAFKAIDRFEGNAQLGTWLHRIAVNASLMKLRSRKRRRDEVSIEALLPSFKPDGHMSRSPGAWNTTSDDLAQQDETKRRIRELIESLPADYRDVVLLRDIEELDTRQTGQILGVSDSAVKTRLHRARQALRILLEQEFSQ
jgi:RNA polymerase sigma-70 factor (ECF subfamily)